METYILQSLRYKDFKLLHKHSYESAQPCLSGVVPPGTLVEVSKLSEANEIMQKSGKEMTELWRWWSSRRANGGDGAVGGVQ